MTNMELNNNIGRYSTFSFIFSLLGGLLVLFTDFGGWSETYFDGYYTTYPDYYVYIGSENMPFIGYPILIGIGLALLYTAYVSYQSMTSDISTEKIKIGMITASIALGGVILGALIFTVLAEDATDWWLDIGFYAGLIGSLFSLIFLNLIKESKEDK